jgi:uncharacterized cupin superfamily protein
MSVDANVFAPEWDADMPDLGRRAMRLADRIGSSELGATLYEIDAGGAVSPLHIHYANAELLVVLSGRPELHTSEESRELEPGAVVAFPRGPTGAHRIANRGSDPARVIVVSTMNRPEVTELVTTGALMVSATGDTRKVFAAESAQEFLPLWRAAFETDRGSGVDVVQRSS